MSESAAHLRDLVAAGTLRARDAVDASFGIAAGGGMHDDGLGYLLAVDRDAARRAADAVDRRVVAGEGAGPLAGVPVAVKDNIATLALPTTCGSRMLEGYVSPFEATAVRRLREAGAVVIGKTNMDEFGMGSSTEYSAFGAARNPVDPSRVPGGSSGGSAAAVAHGAVRIALGSETGGSVRQPASYCGIVGIKPTYGRVSRHGLVAFASSLDCIGVFGRDVDDAALGLEAIAGADPFDSTCNVDHPRARYRDAAHERLDGIVVGRPAEFFPDALDPDIARRCDRACDALRDLGAEVRDVSLPHTRHAIPAYYVIAPAEASSNLARFDGTRFGMRAGEASDLRSLYERTRMRGFGPEVTRRILLGTYVLSSGYHEAYYRRAQSVRSLIAADFQSVFSGGVDLLFTPTAPTTAFPLGASRDPYAMYLNDVFTVSASLAGVPALSLPIGRVAGLPVGGQLIADHFREDLIFAAAYALERALGSEAHRA